jgi:hypothetical protein
VADARKWKNGDRVRVLAHCGHAWLCGAIGYVNPRGPNDAPWIYRITIIEKEGYPHIVGSTYLVEENDLETYVPGESDRSSALIANEDLAAEVATLRKDRERLEWLLQRIRAIAKPEFLYQTSAYLWSDRHSDKPATPRTMIDVLMEEQWEPSSLQSPSTTN